MSQKLLEYDGLLNATYQCTQKPAMIEVASTNASQKMERFQHVSNMYQTQAEENDLQFLRDSISLGNSTMVLILSCAGSKDILQNPKPR